MVLVHFSCKLGMEMLLLFCCHFFLLLCVPVLLACSRVAFLFLVFLPFCLLLNLVESSSSSSSNRGPPFHPPFEIRVCLIDVRFDALPQASQLPPGSLWWYALFWGRVVEWHELPTLYRRDQHMNAVYVLMKNLKGEDLQ